MPNWNLFAGLTIALTIVMLVLARLTADALSTPVGGGEDAPTTEARPGSPADRTRKAPMETQTLLVNAALSHGVLGAVLVGVLWYAQIPSAALGLAVDGRAVLLGVGFGLALAVANEAAARVADRVGIDTDESLRELLAPETPPGWLFLLVVVLPTIAFVEELLFRAALIGGLAAGYGLPVWGLAVASSIAFGLGHGVQGDGGVIVTGLLGFVLAAGYVVTGSLLVVVVAHYLVNAIEFVVHEGLEHSLG